MLCRIQYAYLYMEVNAEHETVRNAVGVMFHTWGIFYRVPMLWL
jgi:hypothetical protein